MVFEYWKVQLHSFIGKNNYIVISYFRWIKFVRGYILVTHRSDIIDMINQMHCNDKNSQYHNYNYQSKIKKMNKQKTPQQQIDFSIIDEQKQGMKDFDFSVESLLSQKQQRSTSKNKNTGRTGIEIIDSVVEKRQTQPNGSFLRDLQKLQQQISYETQSYNLYAEQLDFTIYPNQPSHYQPKTNHSSNQHKYNTYSHLILDFKHTNQHKKYPQKKITSKDNKLKPTKVSSSKSKSKPKPIPKITNKITNQPKTIENQIMIRSEKITKQQDKQNIPKIQKINDYFGYNSCTLTFTKKPMKNSGNIIKRNKQIDHQINNKSQKGSPSSSKSSSKLFMSTKSLSKEKEYQKSKKEKKKTIWNI